MEDETERMRAELLKKEKELIELRQKELDLQIAKFKNQGLDQVNFHNNFPVPCHFLSSDTKYINEINILLANVLLSRRKGDTYHQNVSKYHQILSKLQKYFSCYDQFSSLQKVQDLG